MKLKLDMDNAADREKLHRPVLDLVAGRKYDAAGNMIETHEHAGDFKEP
jgi:hypothetical protein